MRSKSHIKIEKVKAIRENEIERIHPVKGTQTRKGIKSGTKRKWQRKSIPFPMTTETRRRDDIDDDSEKNDDNNNVKTDLSHPARE